MNMVWKCKECDSNCVYIESCDGEILSKTFMTKKRPTKCPHGGKCKWKLME